MRSKSWGALFGVLALYAGSAHAQPDSPRVAAVKAHIGPMIKAGLEADLVVICGYRSSEWAQRISTGMLYSLDSDAGYHALNKAERAAVDAWWVTLKPQVERDVLGSDLHNCSRLFNSPLVARLDRLDESLTGNYH